MKKEEIQLVIEMEAMHIAGHLDPNLANQICLHDAGSERDVFIERAYDLGLRVDLEEDVPPGEDAFENIIRVWWSMDCQFRHYARWSEDDHPAVQAERGG